MSFANPAPATNFSGFMSGDVKSLVSTGLFALGIANVGSVLGANQQAADTAQRLLDVIPKGGPDLRLRLPLVAVQGLVHLS
jgi:hypothetical protein